MPSPTLRRAAAPGLLLLALASCGDDAPAEGTASAGTGTLETVVDGLNNPAGVTFSPDGRLTVCEAGDASASNNGRVLTVEGGEAKDLVTGFPTEFWKVGKDGAPDRYKLGPLSAVWTGESTFAVSNGGLADGVDHLLFFDGPGTAADGAPSNGIPPTSDDPADKGEGNFCGLSLADDGTIFVCGQGADAKSWTLTADPATKTLTPFASADENGIATNSPMQTLPWDGGTVLVLYSGAGGKEDGLIAQWDVAKKEPVKQWELAGIKDPMGMARVPGTDQVVVVDNNWSLTAVNAGKAARVTLFGADAGKVEVLREDLMGPTSCAFGPDGRLYVSLLGPEFDANKGSVVAFQP